MKQVSVTVYEYDELPAKVQEKLKNEATEFLINSNFEAFNEWGPEYLNSEYGIKAEIFYSLSYCQGDGLHFITDDFLTDKALEEFSKQPEVVLDKRLVEILKKYRAEGYKVRTRHNGNHLYEYSTARDVEFDDDFEEDLVKEEVEVYEKATQLFAKFYLTICSNLEKCGYNQYEVDEEVLRDILTDSLYYSDGRIYESK